MVSKDCGVTSGVTATRSTAPHCIAVIHARGGSKRLPLKNIKPLKGRPLIAWCVEAALGAKFLDRVMVSTDHDRIAQAARAAGVPTIRTKPSLPDAPTTGNPFPPWCARETYGCHFHPE